MTNTQSQPVLTRASVEAEIARLKVEEARLWAIAQEIERELKPLKEVAYDAAAKWLKARQQLKGFEAAMALTFLNEDKESTPEMEAAK